MRGWIIALSVLGIATASTGSLIGERSYVTTAIEWNDADFVEREDAGKHLATLAGTSAVATDESAAGQATVALADTREEPATQSDTAGNEAATPSQLARIPSITAEAEPEEVEEPKVAPAAEPAPVAPAPRPIEAAPAVRPAPVPAPAPVAMPAKPAPTESLAIVCVAGCGPKKVVYEAVPTPARPERIGGVLHAAVLTNQRTEPAAIQCVAGCYGVTPRAYKSPAPVRVTQATNADYASYGYLTPIELHGPRGRVRVQRGARPPRSGY